jgi:hypothetical protein
MYVCIYASMYMHICRKAESLSLSEHGKSPYTQTHNHERISKCLKRMYMQYKVRSHQKVVCARMYVEPPVNDKQNHFKAYFIS